MARSAREIENLLGAGMAALMILGRLLPALIDRGIIGEDAARDLLDAILLDLEAAQPTARPAGANSAARLHVEGMIARLGLGNSARSP